MFFSYLLLALVIGLIGFLCILPTLLGIRRMKVQLTKAIENGDLSLAKRLLAELEKKYSQIIADKREINEEEIKKKWTKAGKEKVKSEFLEEEKEWMDDLNEYRDKVASLALRQ